MDAAGLDNLMQQARVIRAQEERTNIVNAPLRVLYITTEIPYPLTSGFLRHYQFLRHMGERHEITYFSLSKKKGLTPEARQALSPFVKEIRLFSALAEAVPWWIRTTARLPVVGKKWQGALRMRWAALQLKHAVASQLRREQYDLIMFSGKNTFPAIANVRDVPIVADCCDATSARVAGEIKHARLARKLWLLLRYVEVRHIEKRLVRATPFLAFASHRDRKAMLGDLEAGEILPQAVDADYWTRDSLPRKENSLVFTGVMSYSPNHDAAMFLIEKIAPLVRKKIPDLEIVIAGRDPLPALQAAAQRDTKTKITGFVEDLRPYLAQAAIYAAPIRYASGVQNKILEAMAMAVPVVTTGVVAEGLRLAQQSDPPLCLAENEREFAETLIRLLKRKPEREYLAQAGRAFVEKNFVWARNFEKLEKLWRTAAGRKNQQ